LGGLGAVGFEFGVDGLLCLVCLVLDDVADELVCFGCGEAFAVVAGEFSFDVEAPELAAGGFFGFGHGSLRNVCSSVVSTGFA
jgi:hypothetical protein